MINTRSLIEALNGRWHGQYGTAPCPVCQPDGRKDQNALTVSEGSDGRLLVHCKRANCAFTAIMAAAGFGLGKFQPVCPDYIERSKAESRARAKRKSRQAHRIWQETYPIGGTIAEKYLRGRGITIDLPNTLRFHPEAFHGPTGRRHTALVALVEGGDGFAIHRTYLRLDGEGKAGLDGGDKLMLGATAGGAVRLTSGSGPILVGEGIESTLSAFILHGNPTAAAWATLSTSGMRGVRLPTVGALGYLRGARRSLILAVDGDKAGREAGKELAMLAVGQGWWVGTVDPGDGADWNDRISEKGQSYECA